MELIRAKSVLSLPIENSIVFISEDEQNLPLVGRKGDAGWDIKATGIRKELEIYYISTGVKYCIPAGYELQLRMKSGTYKNTRLLLTNGVGTLDSGYRGEIIASCVNFLDIDFSVMADKIPNKYLFQLVISNYIKPGIEIIPIEYIVLIANETEYNNWDAILPSDRGADGGIVRNA